MIMGIYSVRIVCFLLIASNWVMGGAYGSRELNEDGHLPVPPKPAETTITFFMHDIVGGSNPTAKPLIAGGLPSNAGRPFQFPQSVYNSFSNGQIPFNNPINGPFQFQFPQYPALPFSNGQIPFNGPSNSPFQFPLYPGLPSSYGQIPPGRPFPFPQNGALPFSNGQISYGWPHAFASGAVPVNKGYGGVIVIDDPLTEGPDHSSALLGKGQGYYAPYGDDATTLSLSFTAKFEDAQYEGSTIEFSGIDNTALHQREIAVVGGSGKFHNAQGHAIIETVSNSDLETVLKFTVNLTY